jgi:hypothetical protein
MMTAIEINQIQIHDYLRTRGIYPARHYCSYSMYHSPFRKESTPSFKVSEVRNLWIDYGTGDGGTLIDLVLKMNPEFNVARAMAEIEAAMLTDRIFSFHQPMQVASAENPTSVNEPNRINIYKIKNVGSNSALSDYIKSRRIGLKTASKYCKELYFKIGDKNFFGIGCENDNGGWAIRNKFWKGCSAQGVSYYKKGYAQLAVFEGVFDLLSYLEIEGEKNLAQDFIVLNSLTNLQKSMATLSVYDAVLLFLDRDASGQKATDFLKANLNKCYDLSDWYAPFKDINDYLVSGNAYGMKRSARCK